MKICVIGTGYVGLVAGEGLAELGSQVICVDVDKEKIAHLKEGKTPFYEKGLKDLIRKNQKAGRLIFTTHLDEGVHPSNIIFIAVDTPAKESGEADLSFVIKVAEDLFPLMNEYKIYGFALFVCLISKILMGSGSIIFKRFFYKRSESRTETVIPKICETIVN